ncbi:cytochrome b/b6 domain-containing protein [Streptomyces sp. NBC_01023]|uniref:cytochrome b n=1 Tax=Streptomyces sp. NBC_01023 TaxID=2903724 RepID=UPI00386BB983|nr:cytochrome b/b6 domain-containing protein [Streptomyces sp. NBC_01023]
MNTPVNDHAREDASGSTAGGGTDGGIGEVEAPPRFALFSRLLHWAMAAAVVAMLFIGVAMVTSLDHYAVLRSVHEPLGVLILILVVIRFINHLLHRPPPHPPSMGRWERLAATGSEYLMYALMFAQPLVGWGMVMAAGTPVELYGSLHLPTVLPAGQDLYAALRETHTVLAYLLFAVFTAHMCAVLFHTLVRRDRLLGRMGFGRGPRPGQ